MFRGQANLLRRFPAQLQLSRLQFAKQPHGLSPRVAVLLTVRHYASPGRPKKAVGEPSKTVKRAVKREAAGTGSRGSPATAKKKATSKKPAQKKKKVLTEKQQEARRVRVARATNTKLRERALDPPQHRSVTAYQLFTAEKMKSGSSKGSNKGQPAAVVRSELTQRVRDSSAQWRSISSADLEHYNHLAQNATRERQAAYKRWVESHSPDQIEDANAARRKLQKIYPSLKAKRWFLIHDERAVKRPVNEYVQFAMNRQASGDFKNIPVTERVKLISKEWSALNTSEKEKYRTLATRDKDRYTSEYKSVYGHPPPSINGSAPRAAAAA